MTVKVKKLDLYNINSKASKFFSNFINTFSNHSNEVYALESIKYLIEKIWRSYAYLLFLKEFFLFTSLFIVGENLVLNFFLIKYFSFYFI